MPIDGSVPFVAPDHAGRTAAKAPIRPERLLAPGRDPLVRERAAAAGPADRAPILSSASAVATEHRSAGHESTAAADKAAAAPAHGHPGAPAEHHPSGEQLQQSEHLPAAHDPELPGDGAATEAPMSERATHLTEQLRLALNALPATDPAERADLSAEQGSHFTSAAKTARALYQCRIDELAGESWEQRRHVMEHGEPAESLLRYIDAVRAGTGNTPRWNQIKAFMLGEHGYLRQMGTGQGKSMVGALDTLAQLSRGTPVELSSGRRERVHHVITTTETLANDGVRQFKSMFDELGYDVVRFDKNTPHAEPERPTVYYMTYDERATAELYDRPPPGRTATIDEADAVLIHNQTVHYLSEGQREVVPDAERSDVHHVRDFLRAVLRARACDADDFAARLQELGGRPLGADDAALARTLTAKTLRDQPDLSLAAMNTLWDKHTGREFTAKETEMAQAFLDVKAGRLTLNRDFQVFDGTIQILDENGKPASDPKVGTDSRWIGGRHQMLEAMFGLDVHADSPGSKQVTVQDVFGGYDRLSLMSGTLERTAGEIKENFPVQGGLARVEDFGRSKLVGEQDRLFLTGPDKLRDAVARVRELQEQGRPVLVIAPENDVARKFSLMLKKADVEHTAILGTWFAEHRDNNAAEEALMGVKDKAGGKAEVTVGTAGMLGRGFDAVVNAEVDQLGGVHAHMLGRSTNPDTDLQCQARAGRNGRNGSYSFSVALTDRLYQESPNPRRAVAVVHYRTAVAEHSQAVAEHAKAVAEQHPPTVRAAKTTLDNAAVQLEQAAVRLRALTPDLQAEAAQQARYERAQRRAPPGEAAPRSRVDAPARLAALLGIPIPAGAAAAAIQATPVDPGDAAADPQRLLHTVLAAADQTSAVGEALQQHHHPPPGSHPNGEAAA
ncbi:MAG: hypothetical protein HOQ24_18240, partial [Mycobacteriaceae bacterium]|nr:hypothetical protein [Mycobacteriaceae bacterium]